MPNKKDKKDKKLKKGLLSDDQIDMAAGAFSGMVATALTHPLDTLSVRAQADSDVHKPKRGFIQGIKEMDAKDLKKLYKGIGPKLTKTIPAGAAGYWAYGSAKRNLTENVGPEEIEKNSSFQKILEKHPEPLFEKTALLPALSSMAKMVPKAMGSLGSFATKASKSSGNFAKGFMGLGDLKNFKKPSYSAGTAAMFTAPTNFSGSKRLSQYGKYSPTAKVKGINTGRTNRVG